MKSLKKYTLLILLIALGVTTNAQQDASFSMYNNAMLYYNPAYAGVEGVTNITLIARSQWVGYNPTFDDGGAPSTQVLSLSTPILRIRSGFGVHVVNDNLGPLTNLQGQLSYAYHLDVNEAKMSFGIRAGMFAKSFNKDRYRPNDENDPLLNASQETQIRPDLAAGVFYQAEKYFVGLSFSHLVKSQFDWGTNDPRAALENHMYITAGYDYEFTYDITLTPTILVKSDLNTYQFDIGVMGTYRDKFWGGLSFRQSEAAVAMLGYSLFKDNSLRIGYAFDYIVIAQDAKQFSSHEVMLNYSLPVVSGEGKKVIRTPRFRH
ncbi:MAG: type IX secretion system membrane protein PorP/SprF [Cyclobacteriaceae bacterium]